MQKGGIGRSDGLEAAGRGSETRGPLKVVRCTGLDTARRRDLGLNGTCERRGIAGSW